jgi:drug/metabolite transporter (DMT)-like permease
MTANKEWLLAAGRRYFSAYLWAIAIMCVTQIANVAMYAGAKFAAIIGATPSLIVSGRFSVAALLSVLACVTVRGQRVPSAKRLLAHVPRNILLLGSNAFSFAALQRLRLADVQAVLYLSPFVTMAAAGIFLAERIRPKIMFSAIFAFLGVLLIVRPGSDLGGAHMYAVGMMICSGLYAASTKALGKSETPLITLLISGLMTAIISVFVAVYFQDMGSPTLHAASVIVLVRIAGAVSQIGLVISHQMAPANVLAPFVYMQMPISLVAGVALFSETPDCLALIGAAIVVFAGLWVTIGAQESRR